MTAYYTRSQILANRLKWVKFLQHPDRKRANGVLDAGNGARCCLGHGCYVLGIPRTSKHVTALGPDVEARYGYFDKDDFVQPDIFYPPMSFVDMVGLWNEKGSPGSGHLGLGHRIRIKGKSWDNLSLANDSGLYTPQEIGAYLESVIEGGPDTPFQPLSKYPEE